MLTRQQFCRGLVLFCLPFVWGRGDAIGMKIIEQPFDVADYLDNEDIISQYLELVAADKNPSILSQAQADVARARERNAMTFDCRDYWPFPTGRNEIINTFDSGIFHNYSAIPGGVELYEVINGAWSDSWYYRADPVHGILEYRDTYPKTSLSQKLRFWTPIIDQPCVPGKEFIWGGVQRIGDVIQGQVETSGIFGQYGWQRVKFDAILPTYTTPAGTFGNVLMLEYWQSFAGDMKGAKMWFAPGLGQIRAEWTLNAKPTGYAMTLQSTTKWVPVS